MHPPMWNNVSFGQYNFHCPLARGEMISHFTVEVRLNHTFSGLEKYYHFWVGLTNPDGVSCSDNDCTNKLKWHDGTNFIWDPQIHSSIAADPVNNGFSFKVDDKKIYNHTVGALPYACMSACVGKTTFTLYRVAQNRGK